MRARTTPARYYVTVCSGFEFIAAEEMRSRLTGARVVATPAGKVVFDYAGLPADILTLRSINHAFLWLHQAEGVDTGPDGLQGMERLGRELPVRDAVDELRRSGVVQIRREQTFRVTAHRVGNHAYQSPDIAAAVGAGILAQTGWRVDLTGFDVDVHVHVRGERLVAGISLTHRSLHDHGRKVHGRASLKGSVAYGLVWLAQPQPGEWVCDPMCGTATILTEAVAVEPSVRCVGGDIDEPSLSLARQHLRDMKVDAALLQWDAQALPLGDESIDRLVSNLPFGRRVGSHRANRKLYPAFLSECQRVVKADGRIVLLSLEKRLMQSLLDRDEGLQLLSRHPVDIGGLIPDAFVLARAD